MNKTYWNACASFAVLAALLSGCTAVDRIKDIGAGPPPLAPIANPEAKAVAVTVPVVQSQMTDSLWKPGSHSFFLDPRASRVGDVITVDVTIADSGQISNATNTGRSNSESANLTNFFGLESKLPSILPGADPSKLVNLGSTGTQQGSGSVNRAETISLTLAALVTQVMPNGNLVINGHQQVRVNSELRDLEISGVVRTEDITSDNTVNLAQIAEARIAYGGKGDITNMQEPRYGEQLFDILMPF
ncbi:MAG: flagellar basal body L-ring protein FlgH [Rhizomicrobium sp.]|jgi:flagellar L-ring protein precursor FlgH